MYIGIDIGGTNIKYGLVDTTGQVQERWIMKTPLGKTEFLTAISQVISELKSKDPAVKGIGISAPGIIQKNGYMVTAGSIPSLYGLNLKERLKGVTELPVAVENDANAAAIAERWIGNAQGIDNYLCIVLGTGVGGGIVINGQVYRGAHGMAGEFGWMLVDACPDTADIETASLNQRAAIVGGLCNQYNLRVAKENQVDDARAIFALEDTNELAKEVIATFFKDLVVGLLNLISCFDPEVVLIGGGISANDEFFERLQRELSELEERHQSIAFLKGKTIADIQPAKLKNDAGMIGAVYQIHRQLQK